MPLSRDCGDSLPPPWMPLSRDSPPLPLNASGTPELCGTTALFGVFLETNKHQNDLMRLSSPINKTPHRSKQSKSNTHSDIYWACWDHEWGGGDLTGLACHCKCVSDVVSHLDLSLSLSLSLLLQTVYAEIPNQVAGLSHSWIWTVLFGDHGRYLDLFVDLFVMNWEFIDFIEWLMVDFPAKCVISCMWWLIFSPGYCSVHIYMYMHIW